MSLENFLRLIGERAPVRAGEVNRPLRQIDQNTKYIWEVLQAAAIGSTVYSRRVTVEEEAKVGMAVYLDTASQGFKRCLAVAEVDDATGVVVTAASAQVWGIVATKHNATLADVLLYGVDDIDISQATSDGTPAAGTYYVSGAALGKLTRQKPPVSVAVLRRTPDGKVFVQPQFVDYLDRHTHYQFSLTCEPAGTASQPAENALHTITNGNSLLKGWLPADHAVFAGKAPPGAVFGYNLSAHSALQNVWPPIPVGNAELMWNKALTTDVGFTGVPLGSGGLCVLNRDGIWWMSNCYGDVPWPLDFDSANSTSYSDSIGAECPRHNEMELKLYFTKVNFATDSAVVLSLHSGDARLKVRCYGDPEKEASVGHLELDLDLNLIVKDDEPGYLALKDFDSETSEFKRGPVVEGLYALSSNVNLSGTVSGARTVDDVSRTVHQGLVAVSVDPADTKELDIQLVRLDGVQEAYYGDPPVMYLEFPTNDETEFRAKLHVPTDLAIASPELKLRFWVLGRAIGTLPQLEFTYLLLPEPVDVLTTPNDLDDYTETALTCTTVATLTDSNQYVLAESENIEISPGQTLYFTVRRSDSDGYAGAVGIIRQMGLVVNVE
jgi:hypothetical protein